MPPVVLVTGLLQFVSRNPMQGPPISATYPGACFGPPRAVDQCLIGGANRRLQRHRRGNLPRYGYGFVGDGRSLQRAVDIAQRGDIGNHRSRVDRQTAGRHHLACDLVDHHLLIPGGIGALEQLERDALLALHRALKRLHRVVIVLLGADDALLCSRRLHGGKQAEYDLVRLVPHRVLIHIQQRFAFRAVGDYNLGVAAQLDMRREPRAARANHARVFDFFEYIRHRFHFLSLPTRFECMLKRGQTILRSPCNTQRRARVKDFALVSPSPVGVAMVSVVYPSARKPSPA